MSSAKKRWASGVNFGADDEADDDDYFIAFGAAFFGDAVFGTDDDVDAVFVFFGAAVFFAAFFGAACFDDVDAVFVFFGAAVVFFLAVFVVIAFLSWRRTRRRGRW